VNTVVTHAVGDPGVLRVLILRRTLPLRVEPAFERDQHDAVAEFVGVGAGFEDGDRFGVGSWFQAEIGPGLIEQAWCDREWFVAVAGSRQTQGERKEHGAALHQHRDWLIMPAADR
jgi:hypothetical protein